MNKYLPLFLFLIAFVCGFIASLLSIDFSSFIRLRVLYDCDKTLSEFPIIKIIIKNNNYYNRL